MAVISGPNFAALAFLSDPVEIGSARLVIRRRARHVGASGARGASGRAPRGAAFRYVSSLLAGVRLRKRAANEVLRRDQLKMENDG